MPFPPSHTRDDYSLRLEYFETRDQIIPAAIYEVPVFSIQVGARVEENEYRDVVGGQIDVRRLVYPQYTVELVPFEVVTGAWGAWGVEDFHAFCAFLATATNVKIKTTLPEYEDLFDTAYAAGRFFNVKIASSSLDKEAQWETAEFTIEAQKPGVLV